MKKITLRFWLVNLLISILLYFAYRIAISETKETGTTLLEKIFHILDILLNLGLSIIYLIVMTFSALTFFLNLIEKIRNNYFLSFLTFSGIPFICIVFLAVNVAVDIYRYNQSVLTKLLFFSVIYLSCTMIEFLIFRRKVKSIHPDIA